MVYDPAEEFRKKAETDESSRKQDKRVMLPGLFTWNGKQAGGLLVSIWKKLRGKK